MYLFSCPGFILIFNTVIDLVRIKSVYFVFLFVPFVMYSPA